MRKKSDYRNSTVKNIGLIIFSVAVGAAALFTAASFFCIIFIKVDMPHGNMKLFAFISAVISCFTGGYTLAALKKSRGLLCGLAVSAPVFAILTLPAIIAGTQDFTGIVLMLALCLLSGCIGGLAGVNKKARKRLKKH